MAHGGLLVLIIFVLLLVASGLGMVLHDRLGERHRTSETKDHVRLVVSILVTFTALVLSLMLSEVKGTFDTFDARLRSFAGDISNLDIHLREYGPDADPIRTTIRKYVAAAIADSWRNEPAPSGDFPRFDGSAAVERPELGALLIQADVAIHKLDPPDHFRQRLADSLSNQIDEALRARRQLLETSHDTISWPLMAAMCAWLGVVFGVFGLLSPRNAVVYMSIVICAVCVASAIFLIDDFDSPIDGLLSASSDSMRATLNRMDAP
ncbi:MAG TPA: hypothetical protein VLI91_05925 [Roseiarcus sp.]|nr:hypothetical protein [Roseiarcus sp.]